MSDYLKSGDGFSSARDQRWRYQGRPWRQEHILKSFVLALKLKLLALASKPARPRKRPVLGSRTTLFFD